MLKPALPLLFYFLSSCMATYASENHIISLGTKVEWKPYHINTEEGTDGLAVRAVSCILTRINQPFRILKMPWARAQKETKDGKLDGFFSASRNDVRDSYATLSKVFIPQRRTFYLKKHALKLDQSMYNPEFIKNNLSVGARFGSNALHSLQSNEFNIAASPRTQHQLLGMLDKGRIEAILENALVFESLIRETHRDAEDYTQVTFQVKNMGVYFGHQFLQQHPNFINRFNKNIVACAGSILEE